MSSSATSPLSPRSTTSPPPPSSRARSDSRMLPARGADTDSDTETEGATIIPEPGSLIGDLLDMDLHPRETEGSADAGPAPDLLGGGLGELLTGGPPASGGQNTNSLLGDIFGMGGTAHTGYVPPKQVWLTAQKGKGLEISGTWSLRNNVITMEMTFSNKAMQAMQGFGIQLNKNSFGMTTSQPLNIPLLNAGQTLDVALPMTCTGPVQKMDPLTNIQVAIKNSIDIFYFACIAPLHIFFSEEGAMEKKTFLNTWKDIPAANEIQHTIEGVECTSDGISTKMTQNNAFTVAKRTLEGQDMIYQSVKLTNGIWGLVEIKLSPGNPSITLSFKSRVMEIPPAVFSVYDAILHN